MSFSDIVDRGLDADRVIDFGIHLHRIRPRFTAQSGKILDVDDKSLFFVRLIFVIQNHPLYQFAIC